MIDLIKAKEEFKKLVNEYDINNEKISYKYNHSFRVCDICIEIAKSLKLNQEEQNLAGLIGLLHDVGRFEQITKYKSFSDLKTVDHGNLGCQILFNNNIIRNFVKTTKYDNLIKKVIYIHNKFIVPKNYKKQEKLYSNIIRDADKIDILCSIKNKLIKTKQSKKEFISKEIIESINNKKIINLIYINSNLDNILFNLAFIYDINYKYSFKRIKKEDLITKIIDGLYIKNYKIKKIMNELKEKLNSDLDSFIGGI